MYERPQVEHVRSIDVSREKWSCLRIFGFDFSDLPENNDLVVICLLVGGSFSVPSPKCLRFFVIDVGDDDGDEDGSDRREREL